MKYVKQFLIILLISFIGELLKYLLPFPIPASIYGLAILFFALQFKILKLEAIQETAKFLIEIMPLMFIPAGVGLLESWGALQKILIPVTVILVVSTVFVMTVSGRVTQFFMRKKQKKELQPLHSQEERI